MLKATLIKITIKINNNNTAICSINTKYKRFKHKKDQINQKKKPA
jgi:hypothetical protein